MSVVEVAKVCGEKTVGSVTFTELWVGEYERC